MFERIGGFTVKHRIWIILFWVAAAVLMFFFAPSLSETGTMSESQFLPNDSESLRASELIKEYFPESAASSTVTLVFYNENKLSDADMDYARQVRDWLGSGQTGFKVENVTSAFDSPQLAATLVSPDGTTMLLNAGLEESAFSSGSIDITATIRDYIQSTPEGLDVYVSGQVGIYSDLFDSLNESIDLTTLVTIILVIVLLVIIYRSPIAALVPLVTIGIAFLASRGVLGLIGQAGVPLWSQLDVFLIVLTFGVGTDYCLFLISRFREEHALRGSRAEAMKSTIGKIGAVISASAFAVIVGLAGMAVARYQMIQTMGPVLGIAIFITLLAALTLAPALASVFGRKLFWPLTVKHSDSRAPRQSGFWYRVGKLATGRPIIVGGIIIIIMLVPFLALPGMNRSLDQLSELPQDSESVAGFKVLEEHYDIGEMEPLTALLVAPEGKDLTSPDSLASFANIGDDIRAVDGVVKVQSLVQPEGTGQTPEGLTVAGQLTAMSEQITLSLSGAGSDTSLLFSSDLSAAFAPLNTYLVELGQEFDWVQSEASYQALPSDMAAISQTINDVKSASLVENQLHSLSLQVAGAAQLMKANGASLTPESIGLITLLKGYLDELAGQYPDVAGVLEYQDAYTIVGTIGQALISSQPPEMLLPEVQAVMASLPDYLLQLSLSLDKVAEHFTDQNAYFMSRVLAAASQDTSPLTALEAQFASFSTDLQTLSARFKENGNPLFLTPSLLASSPDMQALVAQFVSQDGQATRLYIVLDAYPQSDTAIKTVEAVRDGFKYSLKGTSLSGTEVVIGGTSAQLTDVHQVLDQDFNKVMILVIVAVFIVLALLLRSLIAPIYLLLTVLLSYGTTLGLVTWIFQGIMGQDGISFMIPIIVFVLLVALGSDYNMFLMSRVREESATRTTRESARLAVMATGGVITACGIILAGTFGILVITPIRSMVQIGAAVAIGVFLDTFIVRALLVPAIASLLGRWNWWPRKHG
jgi:RND superfamily putative drug exporter